VVLKTNIIKEENYLGTIFIYKNTILKNTVEWHTLNKQVCRINVHRCSSIQWGRVPTPQRYLAGFCFKKFFFFFFFFGGFFNLYGIFFFF